MNEMRKLMNLLESVERLDEAAPGLSAPIKNDHSQP